MFPGLIEVIAEATHALSRLDADRLEELMQSCDALKCEVFDTERGAFQNLSSMLVRHVTIFARVIDATRDNLNLLNLLSESGGNPLEYGPGAGRNWMQVRLCHGDDQFCA